jgi:gluconate kinase
MTRAGAAFIDLPPNPARLVTVAAQRLTKRGRETIRRFCEHGGKMTSKKSHVVYNQRRKVLNHARDLARSGEHADHQTILPQLAALEDFEAVRSMFADRAICAQLDRLCAKARKAAA